MEADFITIDDEFTLEVECEDDDPPTCASEPPEKRLLLKCHACEYQTLDLDLFNRHMNKAHKSSCEIPITQLYKCRFCNYQTHICDFLINHMRRHYSGNDRKSVPCWHCGDAFLLGTNLNSHMMRCVPQDMKLKCPLCDYVTIREKALRAHIKSAHRRGRGGFYNCSKCSYKTARLDKLQLHEQNKKHFDCRVCSFWCGTVRALHLHYEEKHPNKCPIPKLKK